MAVGLPKGSRGALGKGELGRGVSSGKVASGSAAVPREMQGTWCWWAVVVPHSSALH